MSKTSPKYTDRTANPLTTMSGHEKAITRIAFLPGGKQVVSCSDDKTVRIWDVEKGEQEGKSMVHEGRAEILAVTRDGKRILSGGEEGRIRVWDVKTHDVVEEWTSHTRDISCLALSPNDRLAASGGWDGKIMIREMKQSGKIKHSINADSSVLSLCFSPNGEKLACAVSNAIQVYDVKSGKLTLGPIQGFKLVRCVLWSLDGSKLFSASDSPMGTIGHWNSKTGELIGRMRHGHTDNIISLSLSPDGTKLVSSSWDKTVRLWDARSGDPIGYPLQHEYNVRTVVFSPSGEFVASGGDARKVSIWRVPWWDESQKQEHHSLLDLPVVPVPNLKDQYQDEFASLDLPTTLLPIASSSRLPDQVADATTAGSHRDACSRLPGDSMES
ncbi:WD40 repeat-like protein [Paxillus ammoniavirescens]|nr:WD40 repeat-like protein [Paxillus ammoniavirescens]